MKKFDLQEVAEILRKGRLAGYAGGGKFKKIIGRSGFKAFYHGDDNGFNYYDYYLELLAPETSAGQEIVSFKGQGLWAMTYSGGIVNAHAFTPEDIKRITSFLKARLREELENPKDIETDFRPRGPIFFKEEKGDLKYSCHGSIENIRLFSGGERIMDKEETVFVHTFFGGIINKDLFQ